VLVWGGLRVEVASTSARVSPRTDWWPDEAVFPADEVEGRAQEWRISRATARVISRGHPWLLHDDETEDPGRFAPGTLVRVSGPGGTGLGLARIEGRGPIAARMWSASGERARDSESVEARVARALARRRALMSSGTARTRLGGAPHTDAMRLVHGEADGLPGLAIDRLGGLLRVLRTGRACETLMERAVNAVLSGIADEIGPDAPVVEVVHLRERPAGRFECVRLLRGDDDAHAALRPDAAGRHVVHERGLEFLVDPGLADPERGGPGVGLYMDQRENRERLSEYAKRGGRWLNLFAHTGAFTVALLAAGAEEVVSVDLSAAYLRWLEDNLAINRERGVDPSRHRAVRRDGRRYLADCGAGERFAGIVLDPPTAAAAGRSFWSVQHDLEPLVGEALGRLAPEGVLFVCRNERSAKRPIDALVRSAADARGIPIAHVAPAPPGDDFPGLRSFPEGNSFTAVIAQRV